MNRRNERCVRDQWCRCADCRSGLKRRLDREASLFHKPADKNNWQAQHRGKEANTDLEAFRYGAQERGHVGVLSEWANERRTDYRCLECGWMRALARDKAVRVRREGGLRIAVACPECKAARVEYVRHFLRTWGSRVLYMPEP